MYINKIPMTATSKTQCARFIFIDQNSAKRYNIQKARQFSKSKTIYVMFYIQKGLHFKSRNFHENFELGIYI